MDASQCLIKILEDAAEINCELMELLPEDRKDKEVEKVVKRWLGWISQVNRPEWETSLEEEE